TSVVVEVVAVVLVVGVGSSIHTASTGRMNATGPGSPTSALRMLPTAPGAPGAQKVLTSVSLDVFGYEVSGQDGAGASAKPVRATGSGKQRFVVSLVQQFCEMPLPFPVPVQLPAPQEPAPQLLAVDCPGQSPLTIDASVVTVREKAVETGVPAGRQSR